MISPDAVAKAVLDLAEPAGPKNVTARALAGELNVSVGALYNYAGSMQQALDSAEVVILERLAASLNEKSDHPLMSWIAENRGHAELLFDLDRKHRDLPPEVREPLADHFPIDVTHPLAAETLRNFIGMLLTDPAGDALLESVDDWLEGVIGAFGRAMDRHEAGERIAKPMNGTALIEEVHKIIDADADDPVRASVRHATVDLLSAGEARGWNFRALSADTGLPLARLHMFGTRHAHLTQVGIDLAKAGMAQSSGTLIERAVGLPAALAAAPPSLVEGLIEVFDITNLNEINDRVGVAGEILEQFEAAGKPVDLPRGLITVGAVAMFLAGFNRRDTDPAAYEAAPNVAALFMLEALPDA